MGGRISLHHRVVSGFVIMLSACQSSAVTQPVPEGPSYADAFTIVHIDKTVDTPTQLAVHACAGLHNRELGGSIFVQTDEDVPSSKIDGAVANDQIWLAPLGLKAAATVPARDFLAQCVQRFNGCVAFSYPEQQEIMPAIFTSAAALGAVPVTNESELSCKSIALDARAVFADKKTQLLSTKYAYENYLTMTTGLAMLNPGYNQQPEDQSNPDINSDTQTALVDFVFSRKLFVTFLVNGCIDGHVEEALLSRIVNDSDWDKPVGVYGYNDSWLIGGYIYEAQTDCLDSANMGAIPTRTSNLSFFDTRRPAIDEAGKLPLNEPQAVSYDSSKTYVAFVIGDGDNIRYIMSTRRDWLQQRLDRCQNANPKCPPLTWTISPHLPDIAPDVLEWYYEAAKTTGVDYFMLPPSGYLYSYPGAMPSEVEDRFVEETERAAKILGTHSTIHWEWFQDWDEAVDEFLPKYARLGAQIRGVFPVNVPYPIEAFTSWPDAKKFEVITGEDGGELVLFRSQSWRGVNGSDDFHPTPQQMADRLAGLPKGTVTWVYMTSDGGLNLENSYVELTTLLPAHVQLVSTDAAARLALEASGE